MAREDRPGDKKLVAYVVLVDDVASVHPKTDKVALTTMEIRRALKEKLPAYMIPSAIIIMEMLPLTPNGKVWIYGANLKTVVCYFI